MIYKENNEKANDVDKEKCLDIEGRNKKNVDEGKVEPSFFVLVFEEIKEKEKGERENSPEGAKRFEGKIKYLD